MIFDRSFDEGNNVDRVIIIAISCIVFVFPCLLMFSSILSSASSSMAVSSTKYAEGDDKEERMRKRRRWIQAAVIVVVVDIVEGRRWHGNDEIEEFD